VQRDRRVLFGVQLQLRAEIVAGKDVAVEHDDGSSGPLRRLAAAFRIPPPVPSGSSSVTQSSRSPNCDPSPSCAANMSARYAVASITRVIPAAAARPADARGTARRRSAAAAWASRWSAAQPGALAADQQDRLDLTGSATARG